MFLSVKGNVENRRDKYSFFGCFRSTVKVVGDVSVGNSQK